MKSKKNKENKLFEALKEGLEEVLAHKLGKITLHSDLINVPKPTAVYKAKDIKRIRETKHCSQIKYRLPNIRFY
jgi:putative transcriptional regulator